MTITQLTPAASSQARPRLQRAAARLTPAAAPLFFNHVATVFRAPPKERVSPRKLLRSW